MAKNILKKSLALGVLMTFLITGSVWAAEENITGEITSTSIVIGSADVKNRQVLITINQYRTLLLWAKTLLILTEVRI